MNMLITYKNYKEKTLLGNKAPIEAAKQTH